MVTEEKAKEKWCPFIRVNTGANISVTNRQGDKTKCVANGCMAWQWVSASSGVCGLVRKGAN